MKILFPYMARWHAVNWTRYHSLLSELARMGHEVHVLQPPPLPTSNETNYSEIEPEEHRNVTVQDVPVPDVIWRRKVPLEKLVKKGAYCIYCYRIARRYVEEHGIDAVFLYNIPQYQFSRISGVVQVFDFADDYIDMLEVELGGASSRLALSAGRYVLASMMRRADLTLAVSHELAAQATGNVHVLPNGVSSRIAGNGSRKAETRARDKPVVGFLGSFEYFVDFDLLLGAAAALPSVHFLLVGAGREWAAVAERVRSSQLSNVELVGGVPHTEIFSHIRAMDICLNLFRPIPVSHRACPIKLFEYMSQKKPVISTRLAELAHIDSGFLHFADSVDELVQAITHILRAPEQAARKAELGFEVTMKSYLWEGIAERFVELVEGAIARKG